MKVLGMTLEDSEGALPALSGYDPRLKADLPPGLTVEYYGDDVLYFAWHKKIVATLSDMRNDGIVFKAEPDTPPEVQKAIEKYIRWMAERVDADAAYPIEAWAAKWLR